MKQKIIISEKQLEIITNHILENDRYHIKVEEIKNDLDNNYKSTITTFKGLNDFYEKNMIMNKVTKEIISPKNLSNYLMKKYNVSDEFIKQLISDWVNGDIKDNILSKPVSL